MPRTLSNELWIFGETEVRHQMRLQFRSDAGFPTMAVCDKPSLLRRQPSAPVRPLTGRD
jgi:hypothetical protein